MDDDEIYYTAHETAEKLQVFYQQVILWLEKGRFPNAVKEMGEEDLRTIWLIPERDITNFKKFKTGRQRKQ